MALALIQAVPPRFLRTDAAASNKRMLAAEMPTSRLESGWRSERTQNKLYALYESGHGNFALPAHLSNHVKGIAVDVYGERQAWMVKHGEHYGWTRDKSEPWHFNYDVNNDAVLAEIHRRAEAKRVAQVKVARIKQVLGLRGWYTSNRINREHAQTILGVTPDGTYGPKTKAAWAALKKQAK